MTGICILTSVHPPFDARIFHKEAKTLASAGYHVTLVAAHDRAETVDGIRITPIPKPKNRIERMTLTLWRAFRQAKRTGAGIVHFHDPELIPAGLALKALGRKIVYDVHEDLPRQVLIAHWVPKFIRGTLGRILEAIEAAAAQRFDAIIAATPTIAGRFPRSKTTLAGPIVPASLREELEGLAGWKRVDYFGVLPYPDVAPLLDQSRLGLVVLHPTRNYLDSYPVKLFEYMAAGLPSVVSRFPLWEEILRRSGAGILVEPADPADIARAVRRLLERPDEAAAMGRKGEQAFREVYIWGRESERLLTRYREIAM
jgi:glycosyltransferase involved in cell wall biosynthesis